MNRRIQVEELIADGVRGLQPYVPGKPIEELERELGLEDSIKLASNESPLGPPPAALDAIRAHLDGLAYYPDGGGYALKSALAEYHGTHADRITLGNGSNDNLVLLAETFLTPGRAAVYDRHSFIVYRLAVQAANARARVAASNPPDQVQPLGHDLDAMRALVDDDVRLVFIANPNNPTGTWTDAETLRAFIAAIPEQTLVVVDEAYAEYVMRAEYASAIDWIDEFPNLVVTRTFSKLYALAGLRVGYSVSHPAVAEVMNRVRQPFNVNSLAQHAAIAALGDRQHVERARDLNEEGSKQLTCGLEALGVGVAPTAGNFVLADFGRPAEPVYAALLRAGIIVRPVANYGLENHLRITIGLPAQNRRLLGELDRILATPNRDGKAR